MKMPSRDADNNRRHHADSPADRAEGAGELISWVFAHAGLEVGCYRMEALHRRLSDCLRVLRARGEAEAVRILEKNPHLLTRAVSSLLIGVTNFFRDDAVFKALADKVLPELARLNRPLRVWSAGCSSGEELYSVAILLAQAGLLEGSHLLGTDCRNDAIEQARDGLYFDRDYRELESAGWGRYFESAGDRWRPVSSLRRWMHWKAADLNHETETGPWDLILWRNMGIYFTPRAAESAWRRLVAELSPGGVLVVGKASRPPEKMRLRCLQRCIYMPPPHGGY